jgi:hypothetical protein
MSGRVGSVGGCVQHFEWRRSFAAGGGRRGRGRLSLCDERYNRLRFANARQSDHSRSVVRCCGAAVLWCCGAVATCIEAADALRTACRACITSNFASSARSSIASRIASNFAFCAAKIASNIASSFVSSAANFASKGVIHLESVSAADITTVKRAVARDREAGGE